MWSELWLKTKNEKDEEVKTVSVEEVVLEALCAYREQLMLRDDFQTPEVWSRIEVLDATILATKSHYHLW